mmetsp:Transcript_15877/g.25899  ORF Transcript_15877/g.25899 Transcript_15877/m.25899 type:complete len:485 (-) Transcript_15877:188-1642(-)
MSLFETGRNDLTFRTTVEIRAHPRGRARGIRSSNEWVEESNHRRPPPLAEIGTPLRECQEVYYHDVARIYQSKEDNKFARNLQRLEQSAGPLHQSVSSNAAEAVCNPLVEYELIQLKNKLANANLEVARFAKKYPSKFDFITENLFNVMRKNANPSITLGEFASKFSQDWYPLCQILARESQIHARDLYGGEIKWNRDRSKVSKQGNKDLPLTFKGVSFLISRIRGIAAQYHCGLLDFITMLYDYCRELKKDDLARKEEYEEVNATQLLRFEKFGKYMADDAKTYLKRLSSQMYTIYICVLCTHAEDEMRRKKKSPKKIITDFQISHGGSKRGFLGPCINQFTRVGLVSIKLLLEQIYTGTEQYIPHFEKIHNNPSLEKAEKYKKCKELESRLIQHQTKIMRGFSVVYRLDEKGEFREPTKQEHHETLIKRTPQRKRLRQTLPKYAAEQAEQAEQRKRLRKILPQCVAQNNGLQQTVLQIRAEE